MADVLSQSLFDYEPAATGDTEPGPLLKQMMRLAPWDRVWLDMVLESGLFSKFEALDDWEVERRRIRATDSTQLRCIVRRTTRGNRRAWMRPEAAGERGWLQYGDRRFVFIAYEPRFEREPFPHKKRTQREYERAAHWPPSSSVMSHG